MKTGRRYDAGGAMDIHHREEFLLVAGWEKTPEGWLRHPHVGGLHNLKSAEVVTDKWIG